MNMLWMNWKIIKLTIESISIISDFIYYLAVGELVDPDLALHDLVHDLLLEVRDLLRRHRVRLGDHRDYVDLRR